MKYEIVFIKKVDKNFHLYLFMSLEIIRWNKDMKIKLDLQNLIKAWKYFKLPLKKIYEQNALTSVRKTLNVDICNVVLTYDKFSFLWWKLN